MDYLSGLGCGTKGLSSRHQIKLGNMRCLFNLLTQNREMARADMVRLANLSPTTVSALVDELVQENLVVEMGHAQTAQTGRRPINLRINGSGRQIPVFSFDRRGMQYTLYNLQMEVLESIFIEAHEDAASAERDVSSACAEAMRSVLRERSTLYRREIAPVICVCLPGAYSPSRQVFVLSPMGEILRRDALAALEEEFQMPIFIGSRAQSMAYAEKKRLERLGETANELLYVHVGEDVSAGIISGGEIFVGADGYAGEIGHMTIHYNGRPCICGSRGCLERYVNVDAVIERAEQIVNLGRVISPVCTRDDGRGKLTLEEIGAAYEANERAIVDAIDNVAAQLFAGIYSVVCLMGIRRVVIGGGIERLGKGFLNALHALARRRAENGLMDGISIEYGGVTSENPGIGVAEYFIDRKFEIGNRRARGNSDADKIL